MPSANIAIVGAGASGTLTAVRLLDALPSGRVTLIERAQSVGLGIAYSTDDARHRLNVRAKDMSARAEDPGSFVQWLTDHGHGAAELASRFVPRPLYGKYLRDLLEAAAQRSRADLCVVSGEAISVAAGDELRIGLGNGDAVRADRVVLALGNRPPEVPRALIAIIGDKRLITNPWVPGAFDQIGPDDRVLIVGTGLTMVDSVLSLAGRSHHGPIYARSRHGFIPHGHERCVPVPCELEASEGLIGRGIATIRAGGEEWRTVMDGIRPRTNELWQALAWRDRDRFRRRLQAYWDVHRHRIPEDVAELLSALRNEGQLQVSRGSVRGASASPKELVVEFSTLAGVERLEVDWVINCTGPSSSLRAAKIPIVESIVAAGLAEYDPLGIGLMVDEVGRTEPTGRVWALGPICRGCRLETTAVPEIRVQAKRIADDLAGDSIRQSDV